MDQVSKYGVTFRRLSLDTLEMLRQWRNSDEVRLYMQYQKIISPEEQLQWFGKINNPNNFYFITYLDDEPFGLFNLKDVDYEKKTAEAGSFLKSKDWWEGGTDMRCSFLLLHVAFDLLKLETIHCTILKSNKKVIRYNLQIGYHFDEAGETEQSVHLILNKADFYQSKAFKLAKYLEKN